MPSEEVLVEYLLGSANADQRGLIEDWLASDEQAGERLTEIASLLCVVGEAVKATNDTSAKAALSHTSHQTSTSRSRSRLSGRFQILIGLTVAAALGLVAFSVSGFWTEETETQVAMAWVEALPLENEMDIEGPSSDVRQSSDSLLISNAFSEGGELADNDELDDVNSDLDFMSEEPPDWLLAAVTDMHQGDTLMNHSEATP